MGEIPSDKPVEIVDAEHMANFVFQFYTSNLDFLNEKHRKMLAEQAAAIEAAEPEPMEVQIVHPATIIVEPEGGPQPKRRGAEHAEGMILFEQVDFEKLKQPPNYGS